MKIKWKYLDLSRHGPAAHRLKLLEPVPAVYSFHPRVVATKGARGEDLLDEVKRLLNLRHGPSIDERLGPFQRMRLEHESVYRPLEIDAATTLFREPAFAVLVHNILSSVQLSVPPLYVGETDNLQRRVKAHLLEDSDLNGGLLEAGITIEELFLRYVILPQPARATTVDLVAGGEEDDADLEETTDSSADDDVINRALFSGVPPKKLDEEPDLDRSRRLVLEEILTRLLRPTFTKRIGHQVIRYPQ